jgi:hypothetical protein
MITPSFGLTATERVLPRMALDFTTAVLDPRVTVTRALNTATRINASGQFEIVNANLPRFDYDPTTLQCRGLLIEETRTNFILNSGFSGAVAGTPGTPPTSWSVPASTGRISNVTSDGLGGNFIEVTATSQRYILQQAITLNANTTYTATLYIASNTGVAFNNIFFPTGTPSGTTITYFADGVSVVDTTSYIPTAGQRLSIVMAVGGTSGSVSLRCGIGTSANATGTVAFSKSQLEAGAFATSYIPTTTTSLTRNADVVSMTGTNFSSWYNASEGTFAVGFGALNVSPNSSTLICASDSPLTNDWVLMYASSTAILNRVRVTGVDQGSINISGSPAIGGNAVLTYKANSFAASLNGGTPGTDASGTVPTDILRLWIGTFDGTNTVPSFANGCIKSVRYWPQRVTNAETQSFSK